MKSNMSTNRMLVLLAFVNTKEHECFQNVTKDETHLWHCRMGHLNYMKMMRGLPLLKGRTKLYEGYLMGKQHRDCFPNEGRI